MSNKGWFTKEDIMNDLAMATGRRVTNIDDRYTVSGERPPPFHMSDEDYEEFIQVYGQRTNMDDKKEEPDLPGITHMLRMVNDYYDSASYEDDHNIRELKKAANTVVSISKLDPNVPDFIPKNMQSIENLTKKVVQNEETSKSVSSNCVEIAEPSSKPLNIKHVVYKSDNETSKTDASYKNVKINNDIDVSKKIDISSLNSNDIKDIREKLKLKIVDTSKAQCLHKKRERNLAIASLLKLYTGLPRSSNSLPPKLMTPEHFQSLPEHVSTKTVVIAEQNKLKVEIKNELVSKDVIEVLNITDCANKLSSSPKTTSQESNKLSSNVIAEKSENPNINLHISEEIKESVKKVDEWLNGQRKKKHNSQAIYFGPVTFKKKEAASVNQSETPSFSNDVTETSSSAQTSESFVPTSYASELTKRFTENSQVQKIQNEDMWSKLERQLKEKDKTIREQLLTI